MKITFADKNSSVEVTGREHSEAASRAASSYGTASGLGGSINGVTSDLSTILKEGDVVKLWNFEEPQGKEVYWHTRSHVLAQAILRLYPEALPTIGPPIEAGFYYDFANLHISEMIFPASKRTWSRSLRKPRLGTRSLRWEGRSAATLCQ